MLHVLLLCISVTWPFAARSPQMSARATRVHSVTAQEPIPRVRVERFLIEDDETGEPAGLMTWRRRDAPGAMRLECETRFWPVPSSDRAEQLVLHVESYSSAGARLVWREFGPGSGRTLSGHLGPGGRRFSGDEWSLGSSRRIAIEAVSPAFLPLDLFERARNGLVTKGAHRVLDPLSDTTDELSASTRLEGDGSEPRRRVFELHRADGTLAGRATFEGEELVAFRWQEGGLAARRVLAAELEDLVVAGLVEPAEISVDR